MANPLPERRTSAKRPESTLAQSFAADLDSMFGLDPVVDGLTQTVNDKKDKISSGSRELQELEARLRATEQRLARVSRNSSPSRAPTPPASAASAQQNHPATQQPRFDQQQQFAGAIAPSPAQIRPSPLSQQPLYPSDRPTSASTQDPYKRSDNVATSSPQLPPHQQQQNMASDYVMVERGEPRMNDNYNTSVH